MTKEEFNTKIGMAMKKMPDNWRKGQKVFNAIEREFGISRFIQFQCNIDCFFDDSKIEEFEEKAYEIINRKK